ncbi:MAG: hypothetical protein IKM27_04000 [Clostridia bacterium]|nr:hypothetical protein [Clostridia bacterium]
MKRIFAFTLTLALCAALCSCGAINIEDTNGDDPSLCSLTEEDIVSGYPGSTTFGSSKSTSKSGTVFKAKKMSGVYTLDTFKPSSKDDVIVLAVTPELRSGNLRVVLLGNGELITDFPTGEASTIRLEDPECEYELVLAAESAELSVQYRATEIPSNNN